MKGGPYAYLYKQFIFLGLAIGVGGSYGRGVMTCRSGAAFDGAWGSPVMMALEGGSIGFQLGGEATDFVLLVMNATGAEKMLRNKVTLGAEASVAGGPVGRDARAATDPHHEALVARGSGRLTGDAADDEAERAHHAGERRRERVDRRHG